MSVERKTAINIINNYNGVFCSTYKDKHEFDKIKIPSLVYVSDEIEVAIIKKEWHENAGTGMVKFKVLGEIEIV